jgi:DNA-directed RNA polymerase subunit RPC12/RpoP
LGKAHFYVDVRMALSNRCRRCGHANAADATICAACQQPFDAGTQAAMHCPVCGSENAAGSQTCSLCGSDLVSVEQVPLDRRTLPCPYCNVANPPPKRSDASAYCMRCGRQIRLPGPDYSITDAPTPGSVARRAAESANRIPTPGYGLGGAILLGIGLALLLLPGLSPDSRTGGVLILWVAIPAVVIAARGVRWLRRSREKDAG